MQRCRSLAYGILVMVVVCLGKTCSAQDMVVVVGASGEEQYGKMFAHWAEQWRIAAATIGAQSRVIGPAFDSSDVVAADATNLTDRIRLKDAITSLTSKESQSSEPLWLVLLGHGTFQRNIANFNLVGPDVSADELSVWLEGTTRSLVIINCASASAPFLEKLSSPGRVIITATRSGEEQNFARFGEYLSQAIIDEKADLDHDAQVSLLEAYLLAAAQTIRFYEEDDRLITEHPLLDDNGDRKGTPADFFQGTRVAVAAASGTVPDGNLARQLIVKTATDRPELSAEVSQRVRELEAELETLRSRKKLLAAEDYLRRLEEIVVEIARLENPELKSADSSEPIVSEPAVNETETDQPVINDP